MWRLLGLNCRCTATPIQQEASLLRLEPELNRALAGLQLLVREEEPQQAAGKHPSGVSLPERRGSVTVFQDGLWPFLPSSRTGCVPFARVKDEAASMLS